MRSSGGPAVDRIEQVLCAYREYVDYRAGRLDRSGYGAWLDAHVAELCAAGLTEDQCRLSTRFPADERRFVAEALDDLRSAGIVPSVRYPEASLPAFRAAVTTRFEHGGRTAFIFPEEARLLFAVTHLVAPRRAVVLGSYYGYWAVWAMPGIIAAGGHATLVDINPDVIAQARRCFAAMGLSGSADFVVADATQHLGSVTEIDLCVLDAEGPKDGVAEHLRDKALYEPIMATWTPHLRPGALLVAHNMLLEPLTDDRYFLAKVAANRNQYACFFSHLDDHYDVQRAYPTTEGVGLYRRAAR
jgi:predicted O-methyltransferase YrrM